MDTLQSAPDGGCFLCGAHDTLVRLPAVEGPQVFRLCVDCAHRYGRELRRRPDRQRTANRTMTGGQLSGPLSGIVDAKAGLRAGQLGRITMCLPPTIECPACEGSGGPECGDCSGSGGSWTEKPCGVCDGLGHYACPLCRGKGKGLFLTCRSCTGSGQQACEVCEESGIQKNFHACAACAGSGHTCARCSGSGVWNLYRVTRGS